MRHLIEVQERINYYYDSCIDSDELLDHYTDHYSNFIYYSGIMTLKYFIRLISNNSKEILKEKVLKDIEKWKNDLLNNTELSKKEIDVLRKYISEGKWFLEGSFLPYRYTKEIKELNKQIKEKEMVIWEIYNGMCKNKN